MTRKSRKLRSSFCEVDYCGERFQACRFAPSEQWFSAGDPIRWNGGTVERWNGGTARRNGGITEYSKTLFIIALIYTLF